MRRATAARTAKCDFEKAPFELHPLSPLCFTEHQAAKDNASSQLPSFSLISLRLFSFLYFPPSQTSKTDPSERIEIAKEVMQYKPQVTTPQDWIQIWKWIYLYQYNEKSYFLYRYIHQGHIHRYIFNRIIYFTQLPSIVTFVVMLELVTTSQMWFLFLLVSQAGYIVFTLKYNILITPRLIWHWWSVLPMYPL